MCLFLLTDVCNFSLNFWSTYNVYIDLTWSRWIMGLITIYCNSHSLVFECFWCSCNFGLPYHSVFNKNAFHEKTELTRVTHRATPSNTITILPFLHPDVFILFFFHQPGDFHDFPTVDAPLATPRPPIDSPLCGSCRQQWVPQPATSPFAGNWEPKSTSRS